MTKTETTTETINPYFYDGDGLRVSRTDNLTGLTTYYVWDSENPTGYPQVVEEIENNQVVRRYGYGLFLENVDIWNGTSFERFYVVRDGTNSVRMLLDSAGSIAATYDYDAFGNILRSTINTPITTQNSFGFHSEYKDPTTGLVYLRARWYEPREGRFLCKDEFEGTLESPLTLNKYLGFNDNPVNLTDSSGNFSVTEITVTIGIAGILSIMPVNLWGDEIIKGRFVNPTGGVLRGDDGYPWGSGYYRSSRRDNKGNKYQHHGIDITSIPGQDVLAPIRGTAEKVEGNDINEGIRITGRFGKKLFCVRLIHITPKLKRKQVEAGEIVGIAKDLTKVWIGITNHVHVELYDVTNGKIEEINPTSYFFENRI